MSSVMDTWPQATRDATNECGERMTEAVERRLNELDTARSGAMMANLNAYLQGMFAGAALCDAMPNGAAHDAMVRTIRYTNDRLEALTGHRAEPVTVTAALTRRPH